MAWGGFDRNQLHIGNILLNLLELEGAGPRKYPHPIMFSIISPEIQNLEVCTLLSF